jgi:hypothetical protein
MSGPGVEQNWVFISPMINLPCSVADMVWLLATRTEKSLHCWRFFKYFADDCFNKMSVHPESAVMDECKYALFAVEVNAELLRLGGARWFG